MIGLHVGKFSEPGLHRELAAHNKWGIIQSNFGSTKSFDVPTEFQRDPGIVLLDREPLWVWHAAYVAAAGPQQEKWDYHGNYLKAIARAALWWKVHGIVVHTGATVGLEADHVIQRIHGFLNHQGLIHWLQRSETKLFVEVAANISGFNCNPQMFAESVGDYPEIGWCLDLAHVYGTGVKWDRLQKIIKLHPPGICHANFPGTYFASSCDVHGWRTQPFLYKDGKKMGKRSLTEVEALTTGWDDTIRLLKELKVPMVVEGSSFAEGRPMEELEFIRGL